MSESVLPEAGRVKGSRPGVSLGIDVGQARVGLAASDPDAIMAQPVKTLKRDRSKRSDQRVILTTARERGAQRVLVGLPLNLAGHDTPSTQDARAYAQDLCDALAAEGIGVFLLDERLTTVTAQRQLREAGIRAKDQRSVVDQVAAVAILEQGLAFIRQGRIPGEPLTPAQTAEPDSQENPS